MRFHTFSFILSIGNHATNILGKHVFISIVVIISMLLFCILFFIVYRHWKQINEQEKEQQITREKSYIARIQQLNILLTKRQRTIESLKSHSKEVSEGHIQTISCYQSAVNGIQYYIGALQDKNLSQLNTEELHCFIDCYKKIDTHFFRLLEKKQIQLTLRETTICILLRMGKNKQDIINSLKCSDSSYRTIKNRIKSKLKLTSEYRDAFFETKET